MTKRGRFPGRRAKRQAEAIARGWTFSKQPVEKREALIAATIANTQENMR